MPGFCDSLETGHFFVDGRAVFRVGYNHVRESSI
jgi:hypothetical protein